MRKKRFEFIDAVIVIILLLWGLMIIYPFYNSILVSLSSESDYIRTPFMLWPKKFDFTSYQFVFSSRSIAYGYRVTIFITIVGVIYSMLLTVPLSYAFSKSKFPGRNLILNLIIFTMYFHGGLIPYYLLIRNLGLMNSIWVLIFPIGVSTFNFLITRNYFRTIPSSLEESAKMDGANDLYILARIIVPLSMPVLLVIALFYGVASWNEWFNGLLFIREPKKQPLQLVLRNIISTLTMDTANVPESVKREAFRDGVKMAAILVTMVPIMCVYPFVQKHFVKGIMLGAIKS